MDRKKEPVRQFELSKLMNSSESPILDKTLSEGFAPVKNATEHIDTKTAQKVLSGSDFAQQIAAKRAALQAMKGTGKAALGGLGLLPGLGAITTLAATGDASAAAAELPGDIPGVGTAYEAIRPADTGNLEEERQMLAERDALENYKNSPAALARMKALQNIK